MLTSPTLPQWVPVAVKRPDWHKGAALLYGTISCISRWEDEFWRWKHSSLGTVFIGWIMHGCWLLILLMQSFLNCSLFRQLRNEAEAEGYPGFFKLTEYICRRSNLHLIFRISVSAEESRQPSNNFIVVMNHVSRHSNCDLWFQGIFKVHDFVDKTCSCKGGKKKRRTFRLSGVTETWTRSFKKSSGVFFCIECQFRVSE